MSDGNNAVPSGSPTTETPNPLRQTHATAVPSTRHIPLHPPTDDISNAIRHMRRPSTQPDSMPSVRSSPTAVSGGRDRSGTHTRVPSSLLSSSVPFTGVPSTAVASTAATGGNDGAPSPVGRTRAPSFTAGSTRSLVQRTESLRISEPTPRHRVDPTPAHLTPLSIEATSDLIEEVTGVRTRAGTSALSKQDPRGFSFPVFTANAAVTAEAVQRVASMNDISAARDRAATQLGPEFLAVMQATAAAEDAAGAKELQQFIRQASSSSQSSQQHTVVPVQPTPTNAALPFDAGQGAATAPTNTTAPDIRLADYVSSRNATPYSDPSTWPWWYRISRVIGRRVLFRWRTLLTVLLIGIGLLFEYAFPNRAFGENPVYKWMYLFGGTLAVLYPLDFFVWLLFSLAESVVKCTKSAWLTEAMAFIVPARQYLPPLFAVVFALLLKTVIFHLEFSTAGEFYFVATCTSLIFYLASSIARNVIMQFIIIFMYTKRQKKPVADMLFYQEVVYRLTDPYSTQFPDRDKAPTIAALLLENDSFWNQARHIRLHDCEAYDLKRRRIPLDSVPKLHEYAGVAFDRLYEFAASRRRIELKEAILDAAHEDARKVALAAKKRAKERRSRPKSGPEQLIGKFLREALLRTRKQRHSPSIREAKVIEPTATGAGSPTDKPVAGETSPAPTVGSPTDSLLDEFYLVPPSSIDQIPDVPDVERWKRLAMHLLRLQNRYGRLPDVYSTDPGAVPPETDPSFASISEGFHPLCHVIGEIAALEVQLAALAHPASKALRLPDIVHCFSSQNDGAACFNMLDMDHNGEVTREEFLGSLSIMYNNWQRVRSKLEHNGISGGIRIIANVIFYIILILAVLSFYGVNYSQAIVPLTTTTIAFGFALGPTLQRLIDSILFVLFIAPYDVGDKVSIASIGAGATLTVVNVFLLYTEFVDGTNKVIISRNADLIAQNIFNLKRSGEIAFSSKYWLSIPLSADLLAELKRAAEGFVAERTIAWKPNVGLGVAVADANRIELTFSLTHRATYQDPGRSSSEHSEFIIWITQLLRSKGIKYVLPPQPMVLTDKSMMQALST